jgi:hypothetical protein
MSRIILGAAVFSGFGALAMLSAFAAPFGAMAPF